MSKFFVFFLSFFSFEVFATCFEHTVQHPDDEKTINLSDVFHSGNTEYSVNGYINYNGIIKCELNSILFPPRSTYDFSYDNVLEKSRGITIGFKNDKYIFDVWIEGLKEKATLQGATTHNGEELNASYTLKFSLRENSIKGERHFTAGAGSTVNIKPAIIISDTSNTVWLVWLGEQAAKILKFIFSGQWPSSDRDMLKVNLVLIYDPLPTTCQLANDGLNVKLPNVNRYQLNEDRPGYTPFRLNVKCNNIVGGGTTNRPIKMFLSSNNLLATDSSVLIDPSANSAKGVGLRVVQASSPQPVRFSPSNINPENATLLVNYATNSPVEENFNIDMGVYYYPYQPTAITAGKINTSATLNIIYD